MLLQTENLFWFNMKLASKTTPRVLTVLWVNDK